MGVVCIAGNRDIRDPPAGMIGLPVDLLFRHFPCFINLCRTLGITPTARIFMNIFSFKNHHGRHQLVVRFAKAALFTKCPSHVHGWKEHFLFVGADHLPGSALSWTSHPVVPTADLSFTERGTFMRILGAAEPSPISVKYALEHTFDIDAYRRVVPRVYHPSDRETIPEAWGPSRVAAYFRDFPTRAPSPTPQRQRKTLASKRPSPSPSESGRPEKSARVPPPVTRAAAAAAARTASSSSGASGRPKDFHFSRFPQKRLVVICGAR